ncbi:MAG: zinc ribbon domain-containing protein [Bacteroidaceae bacterium]|nr:zinc ribbon domain-containing protein [Bacteroidaceae bacterium]
MYCPECGKKLEDGMRFCPECGTEVEQQNIPAQPVKESAEKKKKSEYIANCIMFTNISLLASVLKTDSEEISRLLNRFIEIKNNSGLLYTLVDAGDYTYHKSGFFSKAKKVSLNLKSSLWEYMEILMDVYKHQETEPQYLFIIGGDNVIPMPCVKHYIANDAHDDSIDTDILYSYPYGSDMLPLLENQEIFKQEQLFHVGRLPFGSDSDIDDLCGYLQRDIECTVGIPLTQAYGQCDPNWKNVSVKVAANILPIMRNFDGRLADEYYYNRIILSPMVDDGNVEQVFNTDSSLYYYNLHGGSARQIRGYAGAPRGENRTRMVLQPEHMRSANRPNVVVCEACYGARFINLDKHHSMLLSSIHNKTMNFMGSSRVAWGCVDQANTTPQNASVGNADIMAGSFISALLDGYTAGQAMFIARSNVLKSKPGNLLSALTIVEFNLYGDPLMFVDVNENKSLQHKKVETTPFISKERQIRYTVEEIKSRKDDSTGSILNLVRSAVDANIAQMHDSIGKDLYERFGLTPRPAESIFKIRYSDGSEEYNFKYRSSEPESEIKTYYLVTTAADGKIKEINSSK